MKRLIGFDYRFIWQDGSPSEHGSPAELCFKARHGVETVICRVPGWVIVNALAAHAADDESLDREDSSGDYKERRLCESLFVTHRQAFRALAQDKIMAGAFALPIGHVRSILIGEDELIGMMRQSTLLH